MANGEKPNDFTGRLLAAGVLTGGVGIALYKGFQENPGVIDRTVTTIRGAVSPRTPRMMTSTPVEFQERLLQEAFDAADDVMGSGGTRELMSRVYDRALYGAGVVSDTGRSALVEELADASINWEKARGVINKHQDKLGGFENIYNSLRELTGGTIHGSRGKEASALIRGLPDVGPDRFGRNNPYMRSQFETGGQFWKDQFGIDIGLTPQAPVTTQSTTANYHTKKFATFDGVRITPGVREVNRPKMFKAGREAIFTFGVPGASAGLELPYTEFQVGGPGSRSFIQVPHAVQHKGINFVAADHRGMSYATAPHFAIPINNGTQYKKVGYNEGISLLLHGDDSIGFEGYAQKLHKLHGDSKAMRDLTADLNTKMSGLLYRVNGGQGSMTQARMHSESIVPLDKLAASLGDKTATTSMEELETVYKMLRDSGINVSPLASPDPMSKNYRFSTQDWGERWDIFGGDYPIERRYGSRIRPFGMTASAQEAMELNKIGGILPRGHALTATAAAREEVGHMPQLVGYLSLKEAADLSQEEAMIANRVQEMMQMQVSQSFEVKIGSSQGIKGEILEAGTPIGVDYRTGKTILAKRQGGNVTQKIVHSRIVGDILHLQVDTELSLQDQTKIFGYKAQLQRARTGMSAELIHQYGMAPGSRFISDIEWAGHASLLKKVPQEINKQMAEASWLIMQKRLDETGVLKSGGRGKVFRQSIRRATHDKTFTWKGGRPSNYIHEGMWDYVHDQQHRELILSGRQKAGARVAKRLGLVGNQAALGTGIELLKYAKRQGLDAKELGLIGGVFYQELVKATGEDQANKILRGIGLNKVDRAGLATAEGVLAMPTMHVGGYASFDFVRGRAGMDPRALMEIKKKGWGQTGDMIIEDLARRVLPEQDWLEMERAALSLTGRTNGLPEGIERIKSIREAQEALGTKEFLFDYGGREVYVPSAKAAGMGEFVSKVGEIRNQELRSAYQGYISAHKRIRDNPGDAAEKAFEAATRNLESKVEKGYLASSSLRGKVIGSADVVARRRLSTDPSKVLAHTYSSIDEFIGDVGKKSKAFTVGITEETGKKMFRDLLSKADADERVFIEAQQAAFMKGEKVTGNVWRHPTHRVQSLMPTFFEKVAGPGEGAMFTRLETKVGDRVLDVSQAMGMKLDFDMDTVSLSIIADEKTKVATDRLLNSTRHRKEFIKGLTIQHDIMDRVKQAAASGLVDDNVPGYVKGLRRLVGVKMQTGIISDLVGDMRAAAAFQADDNAFTIAARLLDELEEAPISSKHGLSAADVGKNLQEFVRNEGVGGRDALRQAWNKIYEQETFTAGDIKYSREEFIDNMSQWISASEESGELASYRGIARRGARAQKGKEAAAFTMEQLYETILQVKGGRGDLNSILTRTMRMGPGSVTDRGRIAVQGVKGIASTALHAFKRHWQYPAAGLAIATGIAAAMNTGDISMRDHNSRINDIAAGPSVPHISAPSMTPNRIVSAGGGSMPVGYEMHSNRDYDSYGLRQLGTMAQEFNSSVRIRDNRGAITPEYIDKVSRERYY